MGRFILIPFTAPMFVWGHVYVGLALALFFAKNPRYDKETLALTAEWRPWFAKHWRYSTTLGFGIIFHPLALTSDRVRAHENVHLVQYQDAAVRALIAGILASIAGMNAWWFVGMWCAGPLWVLPNFLTALARYGHTPRPEGRSVFDHYVIQIMYLGSEHERSANAQDDDVTPVG